MSVRLKCPECETVMTVSDSSRGKQVRCGECRALIKVPEARGSRQDDDAPGASRREGVTSRPGPRARDRDDDDREDRRPRRQEALDRPRRRPRDDDDWDDDDNGDRRPRRSASSSSPLPWILGAVGGGVLIIGILVVLLVVLLKAPAPNALPVVVQAEVAQPGAAPPPLAQPPAGQPFAGQPFAGQAPPGQPPMGQPPLGQPPVGQLPGVQPAIGQAPIGQGAPGPVRYQFKPGASYVYMLTLTANRPDGVETTKTTIELRVQSAAGDEFALVPNVSPLSRQLKRNNPGGFPGFPGPPPGPRGIGLPRFMGPNVLTINSSGQLVRTSGEDTQLPYLLGSAAQFVIEPLSPRNESRWEHSTDITIREIKKLFPFARFGPQNTRDSLAKETIRCELAGMAGAIARIKKRYDLRTVGQAAAGTPHLVVQGEADLSFATDVGAVSSCEFKATYAVTDGATTSLPLSVSYRLLDAAEALALKKQREEAHAQAMARIKEMNTPKPITDADITAALADLKSNDFFTFKKGAERLAKSIPVEGRRAEVAGALEAALGNSNGQLRADAAKALKTWATAKNMPALIRTVKDTDVFARMAAIEALGGFKDAQAAAALADVLPDLAVRHQAANALKAMGSIAEKAVIAVLKDRDLFVRAEACKILKEIGTREALVALQAAQSDSNRLVANQAREAIRAIEARAGKAGGA